MQIEAACTSHMLGPSTIPFTEDKLSRTTVDLQLPTLGEGTKGKQGSWLTIQIFVVDDGPRPS